MGYHAAADLPRQQVVGWEGMCLLLCSKVSRCRCAPTALLVRLLLTVCPHTAGVGDDQHQRGGAHDAAAALCALAGACRAAGTGALAAAVPAALLRRPSRWLNLGNAPWRSAPLNG